MSGKTGCCCRHHGPVIVFLFKTVAGAVSAAARERGSMSPRGVRLPILETRERQPRGPLKLELTGRAAVATCCQLLQLVAGCHGVYGADGVPRCCCHLLPLVATSLPWCLRSRRCAALLLPLVASCCHLLPVVATCCRLPWRLRGRRCASLLLPSVATCCHLLPWRPTVRLAAVVICCHLLPLVAMASTGPTVCLAAVAICCHLLPLVAYAADSVPRCCCHALPLVRVAYTNLKDPRNKAAQRPQKMPWPRGPLKLELRGRAAVPLLAGCHGVYGADGVPLSTARWVELRQRSEAAELGSGVRQRHEAAR